MHRCGAQARPPVCTVGLCGVVAVYMLRVLQAALGAANRLPAQSGAETRQTTLEDVLSCCAEHVLQCCAEHYAVVRADRHGGAAAAGD